MKSYYSLAALLLALIFLGSCSSEGPDWKKGNLHTHSYWSDGDDYPEQIIKWYKEHDYDFVALSDHNTLAEGEKWIEFEDGSERDSVFQSYLEALERTGLNTKTGIA